MQRKQREATQSKAKWNKVDQRKTKLKLNVKENHLIGSRRVHVGSCTSFMATKEVLSLAVPIFRRNLQGASSAAWYQLLRRHRLDKGLPLLSPRWQTDRGLSFFGEICMHARADLSQTIHSSSSLYVLMAVLRPYKLPTTAWWKLSQLNPAQTGLCSEHHCLMKGSCSLHVLT